MRRSTYSVRHGNRAPVHDTTAINGSQLSHEQSKPLKRYFTATALLIQWLKVVTVTDRQAILNELWEPPVLVGWAKVEIKRDTCPHSSGARCWGSSDQIRSFFLWGGDHRICGWQWPDERWQWFHQKHRSDPARHWTVLF